VTPFQRKEPDVAKKAKTPDFETALHELEQIVERMEQGELSLEESLKQFERGIVLTRSCQQALHDAEQKVQILLKQTTDAEPVDFEPDEGAASNTDQV
jgi:exodeoxyribonuclease VII small subunit